MPVRLECHFAGVLHDLLEIVEFRSGGVHVEVAGEHHRVALRIHPADVVDNQGEAVLPCLPAHMVQMGVDIEEFPSGLLVLHQRPCGRTLAGGIPAQGWLVRGLGKPECPPLEHRDGLLVPEDGHDLAVFLSVIAGNADPLVIHKNLVHVLELVRKGFLEPEDVRLLVVDHHCRCRIPVLPGIGPVIGAAHSDVVGDDLQATVLVFPGQQVCRHDCQSRKEEDNVLFHIFEQRIFRLRVNIFTG